MKTYDVKQIAVVCGTRPEAIKLAPLIRELRSSIDLKVQVIATGQHTDLLDQAMATFGIVPDLNLGALFKGQTLGSMTANVIEGLTEYFSNSRTDLVLVHGDTSSSLAASLASFYAGIPVGHVEAGLRSGNPNRPFPEEFNRRVTSLAASLHFAPTTLNAQNLISEGVMPASIHVTGNTVVDSLMYLNDSFSSEQYQKAMWARIRSLLGLDLEDRRIVLVTGHRRENQASSLGELAVAIQRLATRFKDVSFVYPVHPSPAVRQAINVNLTPPSNFLLTEPMDYEMFLFLLSRSDLAITDSGGLQEEAPSFGVPILLVRHETERPEALSLGLTKLVSGNADSIEGAAAKLLEGGLRVRPKDLLDNPFGDGQASARIVAALVGVLRDFDRG